MRYVIFLFALVFGCNSVFSAVPDGYFLVYNNSFSQSIVAEPVDALITSTGFEMFKDRSYYVELTAVGGSNPDYSSRPFMSIGFYKNFPIRPQLGIDVSVASISGNSSYSTVFVSNYIESSKIPDSPNNILYIRLLGPGTCTLNLYCNVAPDNPDNPDDPDNPDNPDDPDNPDTGDGTITGTITGNVTENGEINVEVDQKVNLDLEVPAGPAAPSVKPLDPLDSTFSRYKNVTVNVPGHGTFQYPGFDIPILITDSTVRVSIGAGLENSTISSAFRSLQGLVKGFCYLLITVVFFRCTLKLFRKNS